MQDVYSINYKPNAEIIKEITLVVIKALYIADAVWVWSHPVWACLEALPLPRPV